MSFCGYVRKINKIEYANGVGNHMKEALEKLFMEYNCQFPDDTLNFCDDMFDNSNNWEFEKDAFAKMIENLKSAAPEQREMFRAILNEEKDFKNPAEALAYSIRCLEDWYNESDPNSDFITIDWF